MMGSPSLSFIHRYEAATRPGAPTLLLLHGTGGNEDDLLPLAAELMPDAGVLSPRGKVLERGMPRFFRRIAEGVFDVDDLKARTIDLADFVAAAAEGYGFDPARVIAVGFSNGANIAASLLLMRPETLAAAVLFRAMVPFVPDTPPRLDGRSVLLASGLIDPLIPQEGTEQLAAILRTAGANVTLEWQRTGHNLIDADITIAREWLKTVGR